MLYIFGGEKKWRMILIYTKEGLFDEGYKPLISVVDGTRVIHTI